MLLTSNPSWYVSYEYVAKGRQLELLRLLGMNALSGGFRRQRTVVAPEIGKVISHLLGYRLS